MKGAFRRIRVLTLAALLAGLVGSAAAQAVISGTVVNKANVPLDGVSVDLRQANGTFGGFDVTDETGGFSITPSGTGPFTINLDETDSCRDFNDPARTAKLSTPNVNDGAAGLAFVLDVYDFCSGRRPSATPPLPEGNGIVDAVTRRSVVPPGGYLYIQVRRPTGAVDPRILLQDGTRISTPVANAFDDLQVIAPAGGYDGPLKFQFGTSGGATITRDLGTLTSRAFTPVKPSPGVPYDVEAIVDVSGSMSGSDRKFLRKDALNLLADLSGTADGLGAVGFDDEFNPIFDLVQTTTQAIINQIKALIRTRVVNDGGTNYNIGMDKAWEAMNAPGVNPNKAKIVIFLTDGGHNAGEYRNGHLRFAYPALFNGVTQRPWPVCVVQLGNPQSFNTEDVARLKRIATETGGKYFATQSSAALNNIYFQCRGQSTGQQTLLTKNFTFVRAGQQRQFGRVLRRNLKQATFFISTGGTFVAQVSLIDPRGRTITPATKKKGSVFRRGATFSFFRITRPQAGPWRIRVRVVRLIDPRGTGQVSITVPTR